MISLKVKKANNLSSIFAFAILGASFFANQVIGQNALTLQSAIEKALASEPKFASIAINQEIEKARLKNTKANDASSLAIQGTYGASNADFGMGYKEIYPRALALAWEKRIYDGGQALAKVNAQEFQIAATNGEVLNARGALILEVVDAYANYYVAQKSLEFAKNNFDANARFARDAKLQFEAGETALSEKAMADAALARSKAILAQSEGQLKIAGANLYRLTQENISFATLDGIKPDLPAGQNFAIEQAKESHPLLAAAKARLGQAEAQYKIVNSNYSPKISISARAQTVRDQFLAGYKSDDIGAFINFTMPIDTVGRVKTGLEMARNYKEQARLGLNAAMRNIEMGIIQSYANYDAAKAQLEAGKAAEIALLQAMKSTEAEMRVGQRPIWDVLEARKNLTEGQMELARAEANLLTAKYKIIHAAGLLN
ncbi:MAG: TolC family protein [Caulobacterales bacterium]|nr:TolC family protein [Caulobacterales bacterium]